MTLWNIILILVAILFISVVSISIYGFIIFFTITKPLKVKAKLLQCQSSENVDIDIRKNGFSIKKCSDSEEKRPFDAIVIGSGVSGLTVACLLSRLGWKVLCLEQHDVIGGCTHNFKEDGFEFDTGLHYIGGKVGDKKSMFGYIFHLLTLGSVSWHPMNFSFDSCSLSNLLQKNHVPQPTSINHPLSFDVVSSIDSFQESLVAMFPEEKDNITSYLRLVTWASLVPPILIVLKIMPLMITRILRYLLNVFISPFTSMTTKQVLQSITSNKALEGMLSWCWADYGLPPSESAFLMNALLSTHYLDGGACYPVGGSATIARSMIPIIEAAGGSCFVRAPVSKIILDSTGTRAIGVHVRGKDIFAKCIISSAGVHNTYNTLISPDNPSEVIKEVKSFISTGMNHDPMSAASSKSSLDKLTPSCAMFTLFVGVDGSPEQLGMQSQNKWIFPQWDHDLSNKQYHDSVSNIKKYLLSDEFLSLGDDYSTMYGLERAVDYDFPVIFISSSTSKDFQCENSQKTSIELLTVVDHEAFVRLGYQDKDGKPGHRSSKYKTAKNILEERLLNILMEQIPTINKENIKHVSSGTPLTSNFYYGTKHGEVYGLSHSCNRFDAKYDSLLRPKQRIQGLYLTGQDIFCDGVAGALMAGVMTAVCLDHRVVIDLLTTYIIEYA